MIPSAIPKMMGVSKQKRRKKLSSRKGRALLFLFCLLPTICLWAVLISNVIYKSSKGKHKNNKKSSAPAAGAAGAATTAGASVSFEQNVMMSFKNHHVNDHVEAEKQVEELNGDKLTTGHEVIEKIPVTIRSLGISEKLPMEELNRKRRNTLISLVISYCENGLQWIPQYIGTDGYRISDITIYSKCGKEIEGLEELSSIGPTKIITLPNVGRCDHTYAHWITEQYQSINKEKGGEDIVFFLKDNDYHKDTLYTFEELFTFASEVGFGCAEKPVCDCDVDQCKVRQEIALMLHNQTELDSFSMNSHTRMKRDKKRAFKFKKYSKLKDWKEAMELVIPRSGAIPVCYGGMFAVKNKQILNQPEYVWRRIVESLSRGNNIVEGHFAERLWAAMLSIADEEYTETVTKNVLPHVYDTFECWNRRGMLMVPRSRGFHADLFANLTGT